MEFKFGRLNDYGVDSYILDGETNFFVDFARDYIEKHSSQYDVYGEGELLEEIKDAFRAEVIPVILEDLDITLNQIVEVV